MYRFFLAFSLLNSSIAFSQDTPANRSGDTLFKTQATKNEYTRRYNDSVQIARETSRGLNYFLRYQKEQRAKQKKKAILYITMGVFFLLVLIVGWRRRIKKAGK